MGRACSMHMRDKKYNILVRKSEGKRPLGGSRQRWKENMEMDFGEIGW
jgi:hypothetical protein